jgi:hypothetical protein
MIALTSGREAFRREAQGPGHAQSELVRADSLGTAKMKASARLSPEHGTDRTGD